MFCFKEGQQQQTQQGRGLCNTPLGPKGVSFGTDLEEAREDVKLKDRNVVVAGEVDGGLEGHGLQAGADGVHFVKALSKDFPGHYGPERQHICSFTQSKTKKDRKVLKRSSTPAQYPPVQLGRSHLMG